MKVRPRHNHLLRKPFRWHFAWTHVNVVDAVWFRSHPNRRLCTHFSGKKGTQWRFIQTQVVWPIQQIFLVPSATQRSFCMAICCPHPFPMDFQENWRKITTWVWINGPSDSLFRNGGHSVLQSLDHTYSTFASSRNDIKSIPKRHFLTGWNYINKSLNQLWTITETSPNYFWNISESYLNHHWISL